MGVPLPPGSSPGEALAAALSRRQLLLVLDNCEHVLGAAVELCGLVLPAADDVTVLATSREPLGIAGELYIAVGTVRSHLDRIRDKTSCRRRADLTRLALQAGLV